MKPWQWIELAGKALALFPILIQVLLIQPQQDTKRSAEFRLLMTDRATPGTIEYEVRTMRTHQLEAGEGGLLDECVANFGNEVSVRLAQEMLYAGAIAGLVDAGPDAVDRAICRAYLSLEAQQDLGAPIRIYTLALLVVAVLGGVMIIVARSREMLDRNRSN
jgi:hypothetical protein